MAHSFSGLKEFETCPRKYYESRVIKIHPRVDTEATLYGKAVHEACELYIRDGTPLGGHSQFKPTLDALNALVGTKICEYELAVDKDLKPVAFDDPTAHLRGIADLVIIQDTQAVIFDYKTGKDKYPDLSQLELMALFIFAKYPQVQEVKAALLFLLYDKVIKSQYSRQDESVLWKKWEAKVNKIITTEESGVWPEKPNGLCKSYCECVTCPHNGKNK